MKGYLADAAVPQSSHRRATLKRHPHGATAIGSQPGIKRLLTGVPVPLSGAP